MNLANESWKVFDPTYSKTYLHDADTKLLNHLASRILCSGNNPKILDIGCGNARFYKQLSFFNKSFRYSGFDISKPLVDAALSEYGHCENFEARIISENFEGIPLGDYYDFSVSIHVAEICSSIEKLFQTLSKSAKNCAVVWFEYPRFQFTELEIREYVNHDNATKDIKTPYLRNKYSSDFHEYLLSRYSLEVVEQVSISEKDKLEIYRRK